MSDPRTVAAQLTPTGRGAIATIAVRGPRAIEAVARYFTPPASARTPLDRIRFGKWQRDPAHAGEELVICRTSMDEIEIHCHGGSAAVEAILADLQTAGAKILSWQQWTTLTNDQAFADEAIMALAAAPTERTAAVLLDQYRGALAKEFQSIQAAIDSADYSSALQRINPLLEIASLGLHLTRPFRVVLAGAPNVGKSSLINAILGYGRSIVFDQPGTTRDVVSAVTALDGWPVELSDTAGIRETTDTLEAAGVARASQQLHTADLVLWVSDATQAAATPPSTAAATPHLLVRNKSDLLPNAISSPEVLLVSATTGAGMELLKANIVSRLAPHTPPPGAPVPFTVGQVTRLQQWHLQALEAITS